MKINPGILPHKLGLAKVKSKTHSFIHYIDLGPIKEEIQSLHEINKTLSSAISIGLSHPYHVELENFIKALSFQLIAADRKFNSLFPSQRIRRGLINGLGSIVKSISGNLDAEDAAHYDMAISQLENDQKEVAETLNRQVSLTSEIIKTFENTIKLVKTNQEVIKSGLNKIRSDLNKFIFEFNDYLETRNVLDQLNLSLNVILQLLTDIENAVTFARIGTFHSSILKNDEIKSIIQLIIKYYSINNLIFSNLEESVQKYYDLLEIEAYYSGSKIVFVIHFPIVYPETFAYYHLYSIPTRNSMTIVPKDSYLIMNENYYQYTSLPCINVHPDFYCQNDNIVDGLQEQDCIFQLLRLQGTPKSCHPVPILVKQDIIQQIDESHYIAIFPNQTKVQLKCGHTDFTLLHGNYLINLPYQCSFETKNQYFINERPTTNGQPMLLPEIRIPNSNLSNDIPEITIQDVPLDKIHEIQRSQKTIQQVHLRPINQFTFNYWLIPIWLIISSVCLWKVYKSFQKRCSRQATAPTQTETEQEQPPSTTPRAFFSP